MSRWRPAMEPLTKSPGVDGRGDPEAWILDDRRAGAQRRDGGREVVVERERLEAFIAQAYADTEAFIEAHSFTADDASDPDMP